MLDPGLPLASSTMIGVPEVVEIVLGESGPAAGYAMLSGPAVFGVNNPSPIAASPNFLFDASKSDTGEAPGEEGSDVADVLLVSPADSAPVSGLAPH